MRAILLASAVALSGCASLPTVAQVQGACQNPDTAVVELVAGLVPTVGSTIDSDITAFCARIAAVPIPVPVVPAGNTPPVTVTP